VNQSSVTSKSISIVGTVRNAGHVITADIERLVRATADFRSRNLFVVESDSSDDTVQKLAELTKSRPEFRFESLGALSPRMPLRTDRIAFCRNRCYAEVLESADHADSDYVLVVDLDGIGNKINRSRFLSCWAIPHDWSACCANRIGGYYDIYALRCDHWCTEDCQVAKDNLAKLFGPEIAENLAIESRRLIIRTDLPPIPVDSAFGGLAVYTRQAFSDGESYEGLTPAGDEVCEHVSFHRKMREKGHQIFINPRLINGGMVEFPMKRFFKGLRNRILR